MNNERLIEIIREEIEKALSERELTDKEEQDKEKYVKKLKGKAKEFKKRYGDDWKQVMYATATKQAKNNSDKDEKNGSN